MSNRIMRLVLALGAVLCWSIVSAETNYEIVLRGRGRAWVAKSSIVVSDIADLELMSSADSEAVIALGKIVLAESPLPGEVKRLSGDSIIRVLTEAGVNFEKVGYIFPRTITVSRSSRELTASEAQQVISKYLEKLEPEAQLKRVVLPVNREVFTGPVTFTPGLPEDQGVNRVAFPIIVESQDREKVFITVQAFLNRFKEVPVAKRPLERGEQVAEDDLVMARIDMSQVPKDLVLQDSDIVGMELMQPTGVGNYFRKRFLKISPVIKTGSPVTIRYSKGVLTATATGTAIEDGVLGGQIRVRNDSSRKILKARVVSGTVVEVGV